MNFFAFYQDIYNNWGVRGLIVQGLYFLACAVFILEVFTPLHGPITRIFYSYEELNTARQQRFALAATEEFVVVISDGYMVYCPVPEKWEKLSAGDKAKWHAYWTEHKKQKLFGGTSNCYDTQKF